jgi:hypothetical protein
MASVPKYESRCVAEVNGTKLSFDFPPKPGVFWDVFELFAPVFRKKPDFQKKSKIASFKETSFERGPIVSLLRAISLH